MADAILRLGVEDVWIALQAMDPVAVVAEELIGRTVGTRPDDGAVDEWVGDRDDVELVMLEHQKTGVQCVLPAESLRLSRSAALTALAARELLIPGGVTVAVLGAAEAMQFQLSLVARYVPDISHAAAYLKDETSSSLLSRLAEQLDLNGIGLSAVTSVADTVFGANLVVAAEEAAVRDLDEIRPAQLARGTVLVNATGRDLPPDLLEEVGELYVDDLSLLPANEHRYFVGAHLSAARDRSSVGSLTPRISADLGQLLTKGHFVREQQNRLVLVELLGAQTLTAPLAYQIFEAALRHRLGSWLTP
jgi:ornithine cyclodeaminase/alanine dehydrogenase-like protein (mu-crystallin family)